VIERCLRLQVGIELQRDAGYNPLFANGSILR